MTIIVLRMHAFSLPSPGEVPKQTKQKQPRKPKQPKEPVEKRTNEYGATVRYAAQPSQAVYQRIQRALPGKGRVRQWAVCQHSAGRGLAPILRLFLGLSAAVLHARAAGCL